MIKEEKNSWEEMFDLKYPSQKGESGGLYITMYSTDDMKQLITEIISQEKEKMIEEIMKLKVKVDYSLPTTDYNWSDHDIYNAKNEGIEMVINLLQNK